MEIVRLHLEAESSEDAVVVKVSARVSHLCREGFLLNLLLIKNKEGWVIAETGSVHMP